jgi:hypothetical protein
MGGCFVKKRQHRSFRIIDLVENSRQIFDFTGLTSKLFRNKDLNPKSLFGLSKESALNENQGARVLHAPALDPNFFAL